MTQRTITIESTSKTIRFKYNGERYSYMWESNPSSGFASIIKGTTTIYGRFDGNCTDEGREVYEAFRKQHLNDTDHGK